MARKKKTKMPPRWAKGVKHPRTKKAVGGRIMSATDRARYTTRGKVRKGVRKVSVAKKKTKRNPAAKKPKAVTKIAASRVKGWKPARGKYAVTTAGGTIKSGARTKRTATKKANQLAKAHPMSVIKIADMSTYLKKAKAKKNPTRRRRTVRRRRR